MTQDEVDAKRYRWLRDQCTPEDNPQHTWIVEAPGDLWDQAIDDAMDETQGAFGMIVGA